MRRHAAVICAVLAVPAATARAANPPVTVTVDAAAARLPINPLIYGFSFAAAPDLAALNVPINRYGGDSTSTYAWRANAENLAADYFFESYPQTGTTAGAAPDAFVRANAITGSASMLTIPMTGWVAKLGPQRGVLPSFPVTVFGAQCAVDPWNSNAGDGLRPDCATPVTGNHPSLAYVTDSPAAEQLWIQHLIGKWGNAAAGGVGYYLLDNEPSIWFSTHRDILPVGLHATAYRDTSLAYAAMIKATDPHALVVGPEEWGWDGYLYSGYDQQYGALHGWSSLPDQQTETGGMLYLPWLLGQWKAAGHPVDVVSVHFYPQGGEFSDDNSAAMQLLRNRSTRQLWDPNYVSESWINAPVDLIPLLKSWTGQYYYPATPVAITEYNWGDEANINGATTQADILGIFGQQGLALGTRWTVPAATTPTYKAIQVFRNYDGHHATFGDTSISASVPNPDTLSAFAATRALDGALTVVAISKVLSGTTKLTVQIKNYSGASAAKVYQLTGANVLAPLPDQAVTGGTLTATLPAQSITLYVLPSATQGLAQPPVATMTAKPKYANAPPPGQPLTYPVHFTSLGSMPAPGQTIAAYRWDFGDGSTGTGSTIDHIYTSYGKYTAQLTTVGSNGLVDVVQTPITVLPALQAVASCTVTYAITDSWNGGYSATVTIANTGSTALAYWVLGWQFNGGETVYDMWNATYQQTGATVMALPVAWTQSIAAGGTTSLGLLANSPQTPATPSQFTLNGTACGLR